MKPQLSLICILGSAIFTSQLTSGVSFAAEPRVSMTTSREIEEYASDIEENIRTTAIAILCVPPDKQTFENILRPWNRLSAELAQDFNALDALGKLNSPSSVIASQISDDLHAYLLEVTQNPELHQILTNCSLDTARNAQLNPFQRYLGARLAKNGSNEPVYLRGSSEEQNSSATNFTVLNLKSGSLANGHASDLANRILSENADMIYIQEVVADDHAYDLYGVLKGSYAHFIYVPPAARLDLSGSHCQSGILIASKYRMEQAQFNTFLEEGSDVNEGFLDFVLKNADTVLGHVYAVNLKKDAFDEAISYKFVQIMEKMQDDVLKIEEESIPFVLCGDLNSLQGSQESKRIIDNYFDPQDNSSVTSCSLLLQPPNVHLRHTASISSAMLGHSGLLTVVKRTLPHSIGYTTNSNLNNQQSLAAQKTDTFFKDTLRIAPNTFSILPVKSSHDRHRDRGDEKPGGSVKGGITGEWGDGKGVTWSGYFKGEAHDNKGNYAETEVRQYDNGRGTVDVHGGYDSEKKQHN